MLNKNYRIGSNWKLFLILPLIVISFILISCTEKGETILDEPESLSQLKQTGDEIFYIVEQMPTFQGEEPKNFRKFIAQNLIYPEEARANGITGKVFIKFIVSSEGKVIIPDNEAIAHIEGKELGEVVVVTYRTLSEEAAAPDEKYIDILKNEVIRVVSSSPEWEPGKQRGIPVNVMFTFPVNFISQ